MTADERYAMDLELFGRSTSDTLSQVGGPAFNGDRRPGTQAGPSARTAARRLLDLGWSPIPLPAGKKTPPPDGLTGWRGRYTTPADVERPDWDWTGNLAIRLPPDVIGVDVDVYHGGGDTLKALEERLGRLPPTIWSTSGRDDGSGIALFWVPMGMVLVSARPGIELIQFGHRYVMGAPSIHPEGRRYRWFDEAEDDEVEFPPEPGDLPDLPWAWINELRSEKMAGASAARPERCAEFVARHTEAQRPAALKGLRQRLDANTGSRHDMLVSAVCWAAREAAAGWYPAADAVELIGTWWHDVMDDPARRDGGEFDAAWAWAVGQLDTPAGREQVTAKRAEQQAAGMLPIGDIPAPDEVLPTMRDRVLTLDQLAALPPPRPLIEDVIDLDSTSIGYGRRSSCKSFTALDMALCVASGKPWHGHATTQGPVLYVVAEGVSGVNQRADAWRQTYPGDTPGERVLFYPEAINLLAVSQVAELADLAAELGSTFVIVDTLARCMYGGDENSAKDIGMAVAALDQVRRKSGAHVMAIHHSGKDAKAGARGSSALEAAADTVLEFTAVDALVTIRQPKQKNRAEGPPLMLKAEPVGASMVLTAATSMASDVTTKMREALAALGEIAGTDGASLTAWAEAAAERDISRTTVRRVRVRGLDEGWIQLGPYPSVTNPRYVVTGHGRAIAGIGEETHDDQD